MEEKTGQMIIFDIGNEKFGVRITRIHEINRMTEITELPDTSNYFAGIINLRGDIISVVDLRLRLGLEQVENTEETRIVVIDYKDDNVGLIVDAVSEVMHINNDQIEDPPKGMVGIKNDYLTGVVKIEEDIINILDLDNLLESDEEIELNQKKAN
jgi:purine-binding chemotaxis protein CheW